VYAGGLNNWGRTYTVGYVPVFSILLGHDVDAIGFNLRTLSLSSDPEADFDPTNPFDYQLFGVRYLMLPDTMAPPVPATLLAHQGRHTLWQVTGATGYLQVVDTSGTIAANRADIGKATAAFMSGRNPDQPWPTVAFAGAPAASASLVGTAVGSPGMVAQDNSRPADGVYAATVVTNRTAVVVAKATFGPRWHVTVDGVSVKPEMVAPSLVGVTVPVGQHTVVFRYVPVHGYILILTLSGLGLIVIEMFQVWSPRVDWTRLLAIPGRRLPWTPGQGWRAIPPPTPSASQRPAGRSAAPSGRAPGAPSDPERSGPFPP
jgi:hypothetical protein